MQHHPLKTYRIESGLTQRQLAAMFDVSRTTVARWEARSRKVDKDLLPQITEKTGIAARDLRPDLAILMEAAQ